MLPNIRVNGDKLERMFADFIIAMLPQYESLWSQYIGNDGQSQLPARNVLAHDLEVKRESSAQYTYTALEAILCAKLVLDEVEQRQLGSSSLESGPTDYLSAVNALVSFYAQVGRVVDAFKHLDDIWKDRRLWSDMNNQYQQRNNVLHEAKLPCSFESDGILYVVEPEGSSPDESRWGAGRRWSRAQAMVVIALPDLLGKVFNRLCLTANAAFARLNSCHMAEQFKDLRPAMETINWQSVDAPTSSSAMVVNVPSLPLDKASH